MSRIEQKNLKKPSFQMSNKGDQSTYIITQWIRLIVVSINRRDGLNLSKLSSYYGC